MTTDRAREVLELAISGCMSGRFCEWPQLKPALALALASMEREGGFREALERIASEDHDLLSRGDFADYARAALNPAGGEEVGGAY